MLAEEPFTDRREKAWGLPREYAAASADDISDIMDGDAGEAWYFAYSMWTTAPWGKDFSAIAKRLQRVCQFATCHVFSKVPRGSLNRLPPTVCVSAIILPAEKPDGVKHVHGFLRVPNAAVRLDFSDVRIQSGGENVLILAALIIGRVVRHMRSFAAPARISFHVDHDGGHTIDLVYDVERRLEKLSYLLARGPEVRSWDRMEYVPWPVWLRAAKERSKFPQLPPRRYFQKRLREEEQRVRDEEWVLKNRGWLRRATLAVNRSIAQKGIEV